MSSLGGVTRDKVEGVEKGEKETTTGTGRGGERGGEARIEIAEDGDGTQRAERRQVVAEERDVLAELLSLTARGPVDTAEEESAIGSREA
jgi:hypothetical protein